jgi:mycothiol synthase
MLDRMFQIQVRTCPPAEIKYALEILHAGLPADQQPTLLQTLAAMAPLDPREFRGLLVAVSDGTIIAAAWIQFMPGNSAAVWPPAFDSPAARQLLSGVDQVLRNCGTALAQMLFSPAEPIDEKLLAVGGFNKLADLAYLTLERANFPKTPVESPLEFVPRAGDLPDRLHAVIEQSYEGTLDCPELNEVREPAEVVEGYKLQGKFDSDNWFLVHSNGADVGVLILAEHPPGETWELVYMGVVPSARGQGFGEAIVRFAIDRARNSNAERLVLAVDERNTLALEMYRRVGFVMWDRRRVYARVYKPGKL